MTTTSRITRAAELASLADLRAFVRADLLSRGVDAAAADDLVLALEEAAMNVITHGYAGMDPGSLMVDVAATPAMIEIVLTDFGRPFEPVDVPAPDVDAILAGGPEQGFGLFLMHRLADEIDYCSDELGNRLTLRKRR